MPTPICYLLLFLLRYADVVHARRALLRRQEFPIGAVAADGSLGAPIQQQGRCVQATLHYKTAAFAFAVNLLRIQRGGFFSNEQTILDGLIGAYDIARMAERNVEHQAIRWRVKTKLYLVRRFFAWPVTLMRRRAGDLATTISSSE